MSQIFGPNQGLLGYRANLSQQGVEDPRFQALFIASFATRLAAAENLGAPPANIESLLVELSSVRVEPPRIPLAYAQAVALHAALYKHPDRQDPKKKSSLKQPVLRSPEITISRRDWAMKWYQNKTGRIAPSIVAVAKELSEVTCLKCDYLQDVLYGQAHLSAARVLTLIDEGKLAHTPNPLVLCSPNAKEKWSVEMVACWQLRKASLEAIKKMLPWLHRRSSRQLVMDIFDIQTKERAGQIVLGRVHVGSTKIARLSIELKNLGYDEGLITAVLSPFCESASTKRVNTPTLTAERNRMLVALYFLKSGERVDRSCDLKEIWAPLLGLSVKSMEVVTTAGHWLDMEPSRRLCKEAYRILEEAKMSPKGFDLKIFFGESAWYQHLQPNNPCALSYLRRMFVCNQALRGQMSRPLDPEKLIQSFFHAIGIVDPVRIGNIISGETHLTLAEIERLGAHVATPEGSDEMEWLFSPYGIIWGCTKDIKPIRREMMRKWIEGKPIFSPSKMFYDLTSVAARKQLRNGDGASGEGLLALDQLLTEVSFADCKALLGGVEGVQYLFACRGVVPNRLPV